uniref:Uncharacterized protein n=1 Tax=Nicotiana tabacum TaxID=4097 RepID=A0A1S3XFJ4_TOBAC
GEEMNLVLNWKKCHFMVQEGIVLEHKVSKDGLEVDKAKIEAIDKPPPPISNKGVRSFLGHGSFYLRFIKDFFKISTPLCRLLEKDPPFQFDDDYLKAYEELKKRLMTAPTITTPDRKGTENHVVDHLSRLETRTHVDEEGEIKESFPDEKLLANTTGAAPWYTDNVNFIVSWVTPLELLPDGKRRFIHDVRFYLWDESFLFKHYVDHLLRRYVPEEEMKAILHDCHVSP